MKIVCGYIWGLWWWRTSPPATRVIDQLCNVTSLEGCRDGMGLLKEAGLDKVRKEGVRRGIPRNVPLEIVVNKRVGHQSSHRCIRHLNSAKEAPSGSLARITDGIYVLTPAFCVLQIAGIATRLVSQEIDPSFALVVVDKAACEVCGTYSLSATPPGMLSRRPLATVGELASLAISSSGSHGSQLLRSAIPYIVPNTRSPKETDIALLLCLPQALGGFSLPRPLSNHEIDVSGVRTGFFATWTVCTVDFFWPQAHLVVEYDSWDYHDEQGPDKTDHDDLRANALRAMGYVVVTIRRNDLYSTQRFRAKAQEVAAALNLEPPSPTAEFAKAHETLRMMLLRHDRWA